MSYLKIKLLSLFSFILFAIYSYFGIANYVIEKQNDVVQNNINVTEHFIKKSIEFIINEKKNAYIIKSNIIFSNENILDALEQKDREKFYQYTQEYFNRIKAKDKNFWGLHLIFPDNMSFIRVHKPNVPDKFIPRGKKPLIDKVNEIKEPITSFDAGKFGYFLRVVMPVFSKEGRYLAAAEFSIDVQYLSEHLKNMLGYEVQFLVDNLQKKKFLEKYVKTKDNLVVFKSTNYKLFENYNKITKNGYHYRNKVVKYENKSYKPLRVRLSPTAYLEIAFDITDMEKAESGFKKDIVLLVFLTIFIASLIWIFFTRYYIKRQRYKENEKQTLKNKIDTLEDTISSYVSMTKTDKDGLITYVSDEFSRLSGYTKDELIGKNHNILKSQKNDHGVFEQMWEQITKGEVFSGELINTTKDGREFIFDMIIMPDFDSEDNIIGYTALRKDKTNFKKLEALNKTLEEKVEQRTQALQKQLYIDRLTKLGSYYALSQDINMCESSFPVLMLINIDNFQNINNLYGYEAGNSVLKEFAGCLKSFIDDNKKYKAYRLFADEFVLFQNTQFGDIDNYYEDLIHLKELISEYEFYIEPINEYMYLDVTIGVSIGQENPLGTVDMALRYAKKHKIPFQAYHGDLDSEDKLKNTLYWKRVIKKAIDENRVVPVFQPIVDREQNIIKYEVLSRIEKEGDAGDLIPPGDFLEEAINAKQYNELMKIIFDKAFEVMRNSDKLFSINLSYNDIFNHTLIKYLEDYITSDSKIASQLIVEILEVAEIENSEVMNNFIKKFKSYGVKIAIDDFGVGHSNLSHVLKIDPDYLKIDGEFIKNINEDEQSFAMVSSIITFCKQLDIIVIAEYVHSKEVYDTLFELGIDEFQGYYFSAPKMKID